MTKDQKTKPQDVPPPSIDALLADAVKTIQGVMQTCQVQTNSQKGPSRDTVQNLKDCVAMLMDLRTREQEQLENASDEELEAIVNSK